MPWHLEKEEVPPTTGGTGAASFQAFGTEGTKGDKISLFLREAGSDKYIAVVRLNISQRSTQIITPAGEKLVFSIEDLDAALRSGGLEPISKEIYREIAKALSWA